MSTTDKDNFDFWVDMQEDKRQEKRVAFVFDMITETGCSITIIDGMIMLFEAFKIASQRPHGALDVYDLADEFQREFFKFTMEFEDATEAYIDYLKQGVRDYRESGPRAADPDQESTKVYGHMADFFAKLPKRKRDYLANILPIKKAG